MEDLYGTGPSPGSEPEEFSTFCNQILQNSSSSSSPFITKYIQPFSPVVNFSDLEGNQLVTTTTTATDDVKDSTDNTFSDENTCSKTRGVSFDNDFSCDSEKDGPSNQVRPRCSSKRTRAAEVHNLSEKRRRSRINEKMKALQNLIPNSNKTDKASMLDEAIEYLKQLQLQVQMLSMRNGLSLHPFCLPGMLQPMQLPTGMSFDEGNGLLTTNTGTASFSANAESLTHTAFNISNQCNISNQPIVLPTVTNMATESSFGFEPSLQAQYGPYNLPTSSKEICKEGTPKLQVDTNHTGRNSSSGVP